MRGTQTRVVEWKYQEQDERETREQDTRVRMTSWGHWEGATIQLERYMPRSRQLLTLFHEGVVEEERERHMSEEEES